MSFELMANDIAALIEQIGLEESDILGYSLGGGVALRCAILHPRVVRKLVVVSTPYASDGWYSEALAGERSINAEIAKTWVGSPMHKAYAAVAPTPENWVTLAAKLGQLFSQDYDWSKDVAAIKAPTMIVAGDADAVRTGHAVEFFELLGGGKRDAGWDGAGMSSARLAILPATTHYNILSSPMLASVVTQFLGAPLPDDTK